MANSIISALYCVATPIGNLDDITLRALDVLKNVDIIAAEDTRTTQVLLNKYSITTKLLSYHKFSESSRVELFLNYLKEGKKIALVSDAGTPLISDPGNILVEAVIKEGFRVIPIPGPSAITTLLSAVSRQDEDFKFIGFIDRTKNKIKETIIKNNCENLVFYESPMRLKDTLNVILETYPNKKITIARELTKKFEQIITDNIKEVIEYYENNTLKGEIAVLLHKTVQENEVDIDEKIKKLKALKLKDKDISSVLSELYNVNRNLVYKKCLDFKH